MFELLVQVVSLLLAATLLQREEELLGSEFAECRSACKFWSWVNYRLLHGGAADLEIYYPQRAGYSRQVAFLLGVVGQHYQIFYAYQRLLREFRGFVKTFTRWSGVGFLIVLGYVVVRTLTGVDLEEWSLPEARYFRSTVFFVTAVWGAFLIANVAYYRTCAEIVAREIKARTLGFDQPYQQLRGMGVVLAGAPRLETWLGPPEGEAGTRRRWMEWFLRIGHRCCRTGAWVFRGKGLGLRSRGERTDKRESGCGGADCARKKDDSRDKDEVTEFLFPWWGVRSRYFSLPRISQANAKRYMGGFIRIMEEYDPDFREHMRRAYKLLSKWVK